MADLNETPTPIHRFVSASDIHFKFITLTQNNFREIDVAHRHGYWSVFVFLKGSGTHLIDFTELKIKSGTLHFVLPGQIHALNGGKKFLGYAIMFTEEFFMLRNETRTLLMKLFSFMDSGKPVTLDISPDVQPYFTHLFSLFQLEVQSNHAANSTALLDLLSVFTGKCMQLLQLPQSSSPAADSLQYIRFRNEVEKNYRTIHTVAEYGQLLHLTPKSLNQLTQTFAGIAALDFIHQRLLVEAKRLLRYSDKAVKEIAFDLHFTDAAHFTKFFKQKTGLTPLEFKNV
ncbi:MAG: helix-turn-helix domain-containing protein [Chitinophagales bacterium]|nr:helix-turn-helix domain-containing protein [Chitinophagales bacterium]